MEEVSWLPVWWKERLSSNQRVIHTCKSSQGKRQLVGVWSPNEVNTIVTRIIINSCLLLFGCVTWFILLHQGLLWVDVQLVPHWCTSRCGATYTSPLRGSTHTAWGVSYNKNNKGWMRVFHNTNMPIKFSHIVNFSHRLTGCKWFNQ